MAATATRKAPAKRTTKKRDIKIAIETITPEVATKYLKLNVKNRTVRRLVVDKYARDIKEGAWQLNGDTVRFQKNGDLIDGQHRLHGIIKAGKAAECIVVRGLSPEVMSTIDQGAKRGLPDILKLNDEVNTAALSAAIRSYANLESPSESLDNTYSVDHMLATLDRVPNLREWVAKCHHNKTYNRSALAAVAARAERKYGKRKVDVFVEQVITGEKLRRTDPAYVLRETSIQWRMSGKKGVTQKRRAWIALYLYCMAAYCRGEKISSFTYRHDDEVAKL